MISVRLDWSEILQCAQSGLMRRVSALKGGAEEPFVDHINPVWDLDINGCIAEYAAATHLGLHWSFAVRRFNADVGPYQVRSKLEPKDRLVVTERDKDSDIFISVLVDLPVCQLHGWKRGGDVKRLGQNLPKKGRARYFLDNKLLEPMETLGSHGRLRLIKGDAA